MPYIQLEIEEKLNKSLLSTIRVFATLTVACLLAGSLSFVAPNTAEAATNPGKVMWQTKVSGKTGGLRYGTTKWGYVHIKQGGSTGNTSNHELSSAAKRQWARALNSKKPHRAKNGLLVFAAQYKIGKGKKQNRTMCVVYNTKKVKFKGFRKPQEAGIVTAYWKKGNHSARGCN
ncbi:hypothetical protein [Brevibacterium sp. FAM 24638]|uniref:hypothetical protein n=2 Tax=unclassified Brevibacterium TaxID=2614124 RepID=UPI003C79FE20